MFPRHSHPEPDPQPTVRVPDTPAEVVYLAAITDARGDECGKCALEAQHDGPCAYLCSHCGGSGRCPACRGTGGYDDVQRCSECDAGYCPYCDEGLVTEDV